MKMWAAFIALTLSAPSVFAADSRLPPVYEGLWVEGTECPQIAHDEDALTSGDGILLIKGEKYYAQEAQCKFLNVKAGGGEMTVTAAYSCGPVKGKVRFVLKQIGAKQTLTEDVSVRGQSFTRTYATKCRA